MNNIKFTKEVKSTGIFGLSRWFYVKVDTK